MSRPRFLVYATRQLVAAALGATLAIPAAIWGATSARMPGPSVASGGAMSGARQAARASSRVSRASRGSSTATRSRSAARASGSKASTRPRAISSAPAAVEPAQALPKAALGGAVRSRPMNCSGSLAARPCAATAAASTNTAGRSRSAFRARWTSTPRWSAAASPGLSSSIQAFTWLRRPRRARVASASGRPRPSPPGITAPAAGRRPATPRPGNGGVRRLRDQRQYHQRRPHLPHAVEPLVRKGADRDDQG